MKLPLNIAIIGCGAAFSNLYMRPLLRMQRKGWIRVTGLSEPNPIRRGQAQAKFSQAVGTETPVEMLVRADAHLTVILSPPPQHLEHALVAFMAGSHVLCEKPVADTVQSGQAMLEHARSHQRVLAVGQTRRFYPCLAEAKLLIEEGALGRILDYSYTEGGTYLWPITSDAPFRRSTSGGGVLLDKGMHAIDILCWLFGSAIVEGHRDDARGAGVECFSKTHLDHTGIKGQLTLAWDQELANGCLIHGEAADLWFPNGPMHELFLRRKGCSWTSVPLRAQFAADVAGDRRGRPRVYYECFEYQLVQVLRAIVRGEAVPVDAGQALVGLQAINSAYAIAQPWEQPWLAPVEQLRSRQAHWRNTRL